MNEDVNIKKHIKHTNNTLIFGQLNGSADQGVPSLISAISGRENFGSVVEDIYNGDNSQRLSVEHIDDVMRIFKPSYYFSVTQERVDGVETHVVEHSLKKRSGSYQVQLSSESLCFKLMASSGRLNLDEMITEIRKSIVMARDDYISAIKSRKPARMEKQKQIRENLISRLSEPVTSYLVVAESSGNYTVRDNESISDMSGTNRNEQQILVFVPVMENGKWRLELQPITTSLDPEISLDQDEDVDFNNVKSRKELKNNIRQGKKLLAHAVQTIFKSAKDEDSLTESKRQLLDSIVSTGIAGELMVDDLTSDKAPQLVDMLSKTTDRFLADKPQLLIEDKSAEPPSEQSPYDDETSVSSSVQSTRMLCHKMREELEPEQLNTNLKRIEHYALSEFSDDDGKQDKMKAYIYSLTPSGQIENKINLLEKHPKGRKAIRGKQGFELYVDLILEEAAQRSVFIKESQELFRRTLLEQPYEISPENESQWQKFHDFVLQTAKATFEDYMENVAPLVSQLKGIDTLINTATKAKERKPRVLIANNTIEDILDDEKLSRQFNSFMKATNSVTLEELERAISIVVVPSMSDYYKDKLFEVGFNNGFSVFLTPEEPVSFNDLNEQAKIEQLVDAWSSRDNKFYQSGVLCVPDNVLLPSGFRFKLGEFLGSHKNCIHELDRPVAIPSCYSAAGLVARNDDTRLVKEMLKTNGVRIEDSWPSIGLRFGIQAYEPIWIDETLSQGVILEDNILNNLPFCIFEHSKDRNGHLNRQRIRQLNTLCAIGNRPTPVHEYRAGRYLNRVLRLNCRRGFIPAKLKIWCDNKRGIYREGYDNSILDGQNYDLEYNEEGSFIVMKLKNRDTVVTDISVESEEAVASA